MRKTLVFTASLLSLVGLLLPRLYQENRFYTHTLLSFTWWELWCVGSGEPCPGSGQKCSSTLLRATAGSQSFSGHWVSLPRDLSAPCQGGGSAELPHDHMQGKQVFPRHSCTGHSITDSPNLSATIVRLLYLPNRSCLHFTSLGIFCDMIRDQRNFDQGILGAEERSSLISLWSVYWREMLTLHKYLIALRISQEHLCKCFMV